MFIKLTSSFDICELHHSEKSDPEHAVYILVTTLNNPMPKGKKKKKRILENLISKEKNCLQ